MSGQTKKKTGVFRAGIITALILLLFSLFFNGISIVVTALLLKFGASAIYVGVLINIAGAAFSAWVGAMIATAGRDMEVDGSTRAAVIAALIPSLLNLISGVIGGLMTAMSGRGGSYIATAAEALSFFLVVFFISRAVFRKREAGGADNLDSKQAKR